MRLSRRSVLAGALAMAGALPRSARGETEVLQVVTSFPEELTTRYEQEFEKRHPGAHLQFVWKQSRDALAYLQRPDQGGADVYWAPSLGNFPLLRSRGALRALSVDRAVLPGRLGAQPLSDPSGFFEAYDVAGYGVAINPQLLAQRGLAAPRRWRDLAAPAYAGQIVLPIAGKVGFSPALCDIILQSEGWSAGWALLSEIAGNSELAGGGHGPIAAVKEGRLPLALTIDFLALIAKANGAPVDLVYPKRTAFLPGHVAILASTKRYELAKTFVDFVLSLQGQRLLMETDSSRHPARPDAYRDKPADIVDPFALPPELIFDYDAELGGRRSGLIVALFDAAITERHARLVPLWRAVHALEQNADGAGRAAARQARDRLGAIPLPAQEAAEPAFLARFADREKLDPALAQGWRAELDASHAKAAEILASAGATL